MWALEVVLVAELVLVLCWVVLVLDELLVPARPVPTAKAVTPAAKPTRRTRSNTERNEKRLEFSAWFASCISFTSAGLLLASDHDGFPRNSIK